jgi:hypothetical protein|tara:strand:- start:815 stop:919 length:105 start_codon:yes stop_codon:yes gene_type:complete
MSILPATNIDDPERTLKELAVNVKSSAPEILISI